MDNFELILNEVSVMIPTEISNIEQIKNAVSDGLKKYDGLVVTEETVRSAKSERAKLNKLRKAVSDRKTSVKAKVLETFAPLEHQCSEIISLIDKTISGIDEQIKAIEQAELSVKYNELRDFFTAHQPVPFLSLDDVLPEKWKNKGEKLDKLKEEISNRCLEIALDYADLVEKYKSSHLWTAIEQRYKETKNHDETVAYAVEIMGRRDAAEQPATIIPKANQNAIECVLEPLITGTFRVSCTRSQLIALRDFMKNNGYRFEAVK